MVGIIPNDTNLHGRLQTAVGGRRCLIFAGLPGIGKSLLTAHTMLLAQSVGRTVSAMQWDIAREPFEVEPFRTRYAEQKGVAHPMVRVAVDTWARIAVASWNTQAAPEDLLLIEAPLIGGRLISLAQQKTDAAEDFLASEATLFLLPVPTVEVKEALRSRRDATKKAGQSQKDASVAVLDALVEEINSAGRELGLSNAAGSDYDAMTYSAVYLNAMRHRNCEQLSIDQVFVVPDDISVGAAQPSQLSASRDDVAMAYIEAARIPDVLRKRRILEWYR